LFCDGKDEQLVGRAGNRAFYWDWLFVALWSYIQMRLEERERIERLEIEELARAKGSGALFERTDEELLIAKKSREQFEKYFVPGFYYPFDDC
jgi:hypothetical protein